MAAPKSQQDAINMFIWMANDMKDEGASIQFVSTALMRACAIYSTYVITGNDGALKEAGVQKLSEVFAEELAVVQKAKVAGAGLDADGNPIQS